MRQEEAFDAGGLTVDEQRARWLTGKVFGIARTHAGPLHGCHPDRARAEEGAGGQREPGADAGGDGGRALYHRQGTRLRRGDAPLVPHGLKV